MTSLTEYHDVVVLTIKDELTGETVDAFNERAAQALQKKANGIVIDCSTLHGLDSVGLEALLELQDRCEEELRPVKLCGLDATCAKILEITRLARRFEAFADLESAVSSCA